VSHPTLPPADAEVIARRAVARIRPRTRKPDDVDGCVAVLRPVHEISGDPSGRRQDPGRWRTPGRARGLQPVLGVVAGREPAVGALLPQALAGFSAGLHKFKALYQNDPWFPRPAS